MLDFWKNLLKGKKTYLVAAVAAVLAFAGSVGWIDSATAAKIQAFLVAVGLASLRAALP